MTTNHHRAATPMTPPYSTALLTGASPGFGTLGAFHTLDAKREQEELLLNCGAVVDLARAFLPGMLAAGRGGIINLSSMAAFQPMPYMAVYGASKAFVWSFSDALWAECR